MKNHTRRKIAAARRNLNEKSWKERSAAIQERFLATEWYRSAGTLLSYAHCGREVRTDTVMRRALGDGKIVCVPLCDWQRNRISAVRITTIEELECRNGIPEPRTGEPVPTGLLDLVIVPGVAFDETGERTGMGKGFFDRFLVHLRADCEIVALAFDFQVLKKPLPVEPHDVRMHAIVTETRIIE